MLLMAFFVVSCSNLDIQTLNQRAIELMNEGNVDGAIARLESITDLNPNFAETYYNLGVAYHKKGDFKKSITALNKAIKLKKDFPEAYYTLGVVYEELSSNLLKDQNKNNIVTAVENYQKSRDSYAKYLKITVNPDDLENIKSRIEFLDSEIAKYKTEIKNNIPVQHSVGG